MRDWYQHQAYMRIHKNQAAWVEGNFLGVDVWIKENSHWFCMYFQTTVFFRWFLWWFTQYSELIKSDQTTKKRRAYWSLLWRGARFPKDQQTPINPLSFLRNLSFHRCNPWEKWILYFSILMTVVFIPSRNWCRIWTTANLGHQRTIHTHTPSWFWFLPWTV